MLRLTVLLALLVLVAPMSIFSDIAGFFTGGAKTVKELVSKVWGAIKHTLNFVTGIFRSVGSAWGDLHAAIRALIAGLEHFVEGTYSTIRFLTNTLVPKWARQAVKDAIAFATRNIKTVAKRAETLAKGVKTWAVKQFNTAKSLVDKALNVIRKAVNKATDWISKRGNTVWDLVSHPQKLVTKILPSLVTPLLRYIMEHLEPVSILVLRWGFSNIGKIAQIAERAVTKVL